MNNDLSELIALLKTAKPNSLLTWEFHPPYQGTVENLRNDIAKNLSEGLSVGLPIECGLESKENGITIITNVSIQIVNSN
jgi:hypothetical protein